MVPQPQPLTLWICQQVIVDKATGNPSLINLFTGLPVPEFPSVPQKLSVFAALTDSVGTGRITLEVTCLESDEVIHRVEERIEFPSRLIVVNAHFRLSRVTFPTPGVYAFTLFVDDDFIAQRTLRVYGVGT